MEQVKTEQIRLKDVARKTGRDIIWKPVISEKTMNSATINKYTFEVDPRANKIEIRKAVEEIFKVKVVDVNTVNLHGKKRVRFDKKGRHIGFTNDRKKAVVTLKEGDKIEIAGFNPFEM